MIESHFLMLLVLMNKTLLFMALSDLYWLIANGLVITAAFNENFIDEIIAGVHHHFRTNLGLKLAAFQRRSKNSVVSKIVF